MNYRKLIEDCRPDLEIIEGTFKSINDKVVVKDKNNLYFKILVKTLLRNKPLSMISSLDKNKYFICKANQIHNFKYDYSNIDIYKDKRQKLIIICKIHGEFLQTIDNHLQGNGCPECGKIEKSIKSITHGQSKSKIHRAYYNIRGRCNNIKNKNYEDYGGRDIKLSDNLTPFINFYNYVKTLDNFDKLLTNKYTIDRIDNNRGYEIGNLRIVDMDIQSLNKRIPITNKSGYRGIYFSKYNHKWCAAICNKKIGGRVHIGYFSNIEDAKSAYDNFVILNKLDNKMDSVNKTKQYETTVN